MAIDRCAPIVWVGFLLSALIVAGVFHAAVLAFLFIGMTVITCHLLQLFIYIYDHHLLSLPPSLPPFLPFSFPPPLPPPSLLCSLLCAVIEEQGVRLKLTVTDTPGFGDQINNDKW